MFTEDQRDLLFALVEASRRAKEQFITVRTLGGEWVQHRGLPDGKIDLYFADLVALRNAGCFTVTNEGRHNDFSFDVSPHGLDVYQGLHAQQESATDAIEDTMRRFIEAEGFRSKYPKAHARWLKASAVLWSPDAEGHLSEVGHFCREAMQEFAEELLAEHQVTPDDSDKQHTVARIRQLLDAKKAILGDTVAAWLGAMLAYWGTVADLSQRQEHAAQKDGETLKWDDARRLAFQTFSLMYEMSEGLAPYQEQAVRSQIAEDKTWIQEQDRRSADFIPEEVSRERRMREGRLDRNLVWLREVGLEDGWV